MTCWIKDTTQKCGICLEEVVNTFVLNCGHEFCPKCILQWLFIVESCPMCRKQVIWSDYTDLYDIYYLCTILRHVSSYKKYYFVCQMTRHFDVPDRKLCMTIALELS